LPHVGLLFIEIFFGCELSLAKVVKKPCKNKWRVAEHIVILSPDASCHSAMVFSDILANLLIFQIKYQVILCLDIPITF